LLLLISFLFVLVFGGLGLMRREGLSLQFALEALGLTLLLVGGSWLFSMPLNPFLFLALLYLITMRARLMVDVANFLAKRRQRDLAFKLYRLSLAWWPDTASRLIVLTNMGAAELHGGQFDAAIQTLENVLAMETQSRLGIKYEAACHYNLGYAYERKGEDAKAISQYNEAIDALPGSLYAKAAKAALERRKKKDSES
jgi:tetratricopeptide (TPR) repeat protein